MQQKYQITTKRKHFIDFSLKLKVNKKFSSYVPVLYITKYLFFLISK